MIVMSTARPTLSLVALAAASALVLTACGSSDDTASESDGSGPLDVVAAFYPLELMVEEVGGDRVSVSNLAKPGAEPHDLELTPSDVARVSDADLVVYLEGFQPAVDDAVASEAPDTSWNAGEYASLDLTYTPIEEGEEATDEAGAVDPHFWLDPTRYADVATALAAGLSDLDPDGAATYEANAQAFVDDLETLDAEWTAGVEVCSNRNLVTSHNAFGYLAQRYDLQQRGITGLTPEDEPTPQALADIAEFVTANEVKTIYFETLVSPAIAETLAAETGAKTAVLDPVEGLSEESEGSDYFEIMRANLVNVRAGQPCP
jgi:zinc transport system substrate-binding protein